MISSRKEIRDSVLDTTRQTNAQIGTLVNDFINLSLNEISDPAWAFPTKLGLTHNWQFLRRKVTFSTVASTEEYVLPRDVDRISLVRQTESPVKLRQITDKKFYMAIPNPTAGGNPKWYRLWENEGVSTRLAVADTIDVVSSAAGDSGDSTKTVTVWGQDSNGATLSETYQLNGVTPVVGTVTFSAGPIFVSKQVATTGDITIEEASGDIDLVVIGREERAPRFKVMSLYPIPDSAITIYLEYYTRIRELTNDSDVPQFSDKWHWVVRQGVLAKVYEYLNKEQDKITAHSMYAAGVRSMVSADKTTPDLIEHLTPMSSTFPFIHLQRSNTITTS